MNKRSGFVLFIRRLPFFVTLFLPLAIACVVMAAITRQDSIENEFVMGTVIPVVHEEFDTTTKQDVYIENEGNSPIFIRVAIVYNYVDLDGVTLFKSPVSGVDYDTTMSNSSNWLSSSDGYYYYKYILEPGASTDVLVDSIEDLTSDGEKMLDVSIIAQGIQAHPDDAAREAWRVNINNGVLSLRNH